MIVLKSTYNDLFKAFITALDTIAEQKEKLEEQKEKLEEQDALIKQHVKPFFRGE